jgi:DNA-binding NarL/FixJ family response regulator
MLPSVVPVPVGCAAAPAQPRLVKVLLVEDEPHTRARFSAAVANDSRYLLIGACADKSSALQRLAFEAPDVLMTDLGLPDGSGLDVIRACAGQYPACHILVISMFGDEAHVIDSIEAGATGYILKSSEDEEIVNHIDALRAGGSPITPSIARQLLRRFRSSGMAGSAVALAPVQEGGAGAELPAPSVPAAGTDGLTEREVAVLKLVATGYRYAEIAERLFISQHTVVAHIKNIYQKLAVNSRSAAVYEAQRRAILPSAQGLSR